MADLVGQIKASIVRIGTEFKSVRTALAGKAAASYAAASDIFTGTDASKIVIAKALADAQKFVALTDASSVAPNLAQGVNFKWTRTAASTLSAMTNLKEGQSGTIRLDGPGAITLDSSYDVGTTPLIFSSATGIYDFLDYQVVNAAGGAKSVRVWLRSGSIRGYTLVKSIDITSNVVAYAQFDGLDAYPEIFLEIINLSHDYSSGQTFSIAFSVDGTNFSAPVTFSTSSVPAAGAINGIVILFGNGLRRVMMRAATATAVQDNTGPTGSESLKFFTPTGPITSIRVYPTTGGNLDAGTLRVSGR